MSPSPTWADYAKQLPADIPDTAYDAQREQYFDTYLRPQALKEGLSPVVERMEFMARTERQDKARFPRAEVTGKSALKSFLDPLLGVTGQRDSQKGLADWEKRAATEAERQGINPKPYAMGGTILGMAPYFTPVGRLAGGIGALAGGSEAAGEAGAVGLINAAYEAAKADNGNRLKDGLGGFIGGAALGAANKIMPKGVLAGAAGMVAGGGPGTAAGMVGMGAGALIGGLEGYGFLKARLMKSGLNSDMADAVVAAAKGTASPGQAAVAEQAARMSPGIHQDVMQHVQEGVAAADKAGIPKEAPVVDAATVKDAHAALKAQDAKNIQAGLYDTPVVPRGTQPSIAPEGQQSISVQRMTEEALARMGGEDEAPLYDGLERMPNGEILNHTNGQLSPDMPTALGDAPDLRPQQQQAEMAKYLAPGVEPKPGQDVVRGWTDIPLSEDGIQDVTKLAEKSAAKGGINRIVASDLERGRQTANIMAAASGITPELSSDLRTMRMGATEGSPSSPEFEAWRDKLFSETPDERPPGISPTSQTPGETYNEFRVRSNTKLQEIQRYADANPDEAVVSVTHHTNIKTFQAWLNNGAPDDLSVDTDTMLHDGKAPGDMWKVVDGPDGTRQLRAVDSVDGPGHYLMRHGPTDLNAEGGGVPAGRTVERPLYNRVAGPDAKSILPPGARAMTDASAPGEKPTIVLRQADPATLFHEGLHSHFNYLGLSDEIPAEMGDSMGSKLENYFPAAQRAGYESLAPGTLPEETYVHLATAIRTADEAKIQRFVDADESREDVMNWAALKTRNLISRIAEEPDSLHKDVALRRLNEVLRRSSGSLVDIGRETVPLGDSIGVKGGKYVLERSDGSKTFFDDRESLASHIDDKYSTPISAPNLIDETLIPRGVPRYALDSAPPNPAAPVDTANLPKPGKPVRGGFSTFSFFTTPNMAWVDRMATKAEWPALSEAFYAIKDAKTQLRDFTKPYYDMLEDAFGNMSKARRKDLGVYFETPEEQRADVARQLNITEDDKAALDKMRVMMDELHGEFDLDPHKYLTDYLPRLRETLKRNPDAFAPSSLGSYAADTPLKFWAEHIRSLEVNPHDTDIRRVLSNYIEVGARKKFLSEPLERAAGLVNSTDEAGNFHAGLLQPLLKRMLDSERGIPDYTQKILHSAIQNTTDLINKGLESANLPKSLDNPLTGRPISLRIDSPPDEALRKWIQFSYAGALMGRSALLVRDGLQMFTTGFPVLGSYTFRGIAKAFPAMARDASDDLWAIPEKYGALLQKRDYLNYLSGTETSGASKAINAAMQPITWVHNGNRLATFWGAAEKIGDALEQGGADEGFASRSGLWVLPKQRQTQFLQEAANLAPDKQQDFVYRAARELVDATQWSYDRMAGPGFNKFVLGRLFGQYGVFPTNYIEYARRLAFQGTPSDRVKALTLLVLAHGAILKAGEGAGVDTAKWVFTGPAEFGGGPLFQAVTGAPKAAFDWESQRGAEARKDIRSTLALEAPGSLEAQQIWRAITTEDPNAWKMVLGWRPMKPGEADRGIHSLLPPNMQ